MVLNNQLLIISRSHLIILFVNQTMKPESKFMTDTDFVIKLCKNKRKLSKAKAIILSKLATRSLERNPFPELDEKLII